VGKKKIKPISFGDEEDEVDNIVMAEVVTATPIDESYTGKTRKKMQVYTNKNNDSDEEEDDAFDDANDDQVSKFAQKSPARRQSKLSPTGQAPPPPITSREPSFLQSTTFQPAKPWPASLKKKVIEALKLKANESAGRQYLTQHNWPSGLKDALMKSVRKMPMRFFIVDDSGSMILNDGRRLVASGNNAR
jgi:hypothetical protein